MISHEVKLRRRHEGSELFDQLEGLENDMARSIAPAALEAIQQPAVRQKRKPLCCYRGPTGITAQTFEPHPVMGRYGLSMHCS